MDKNTNLLGINIYTAVDHHSKTSHTKVRRCTSMEYAYFPNEFFAKLNPLVF
jgi:hypothetical protein